jgi:endonuclease G
MKTTAVLLAILCATPICVAHGGAPDVPADCAAYVPFGAPATSGQHPTTLACRIGYLAQVDGDTLQPDWVAWTLTAERAIGCTARTNPFHYDDKLPSGFMATPGDYAKSGYDLGHMSGYEDNAVSPAMGRDSFDVPTNFSPQVGGLNRQAWEEAEQDSRVWALQFGVLDIADGPIFGPVPKTIGVHKIAVPVAYWKVVYSEAKHQAVTIIMQNVPTAKGHLPMYVVSVDDAEKASGVHVELPADVDRSHVVLPWPADNAGFTKAKKAACATSK